MKKVSLLLLASISISISTLAQDAIQTSLKTATEQYNQKKLLDAQSSLNKAVNDINTEIGLQVIAALPKTAGDLTADGESDTNGQPGSDPSCSAVNVTREYSNIQGDRSILLNISQNFTTANNIKGAINQTTTSTEDGTLQKIVMLGNFKALLVWDIEANEGDIQTAKGNVFIIFSSNGFSSADTFASDVAKIDFTKALEVFGQ
ncbi:hypothetical protein LBMAG27_16100 [Bacteroidota bacterium]|nr:hypothetical protein LBMAG27_16100 [Bacteroidota bacterium]